MELVPPGAEQWDIMEPCAHATEIEVLARPCSVVPFYPEHFGPGCPTCQSSLARRVEGVHVTFPDGALPIHPEELVGYPEDERSDGRNDLCKASRDKVPEEGCDAEHGNNQMHLQEYLVCKSPDKVQRRH